MKFVDRTCSEVNGLTANDGPPASHPLSHYAERSAWVLLGPPGAGKTVEFEREAERCGACYVTARNFLTLNERRWRRSTLFIDALDEMRAGSPDGRTPLDHIRTKLDELGRPPFRLSCREADWFGASDRGHLAAVSADGDVLELRLEPLSDEQIRELLEEYVADPEAFLHKAHQAGLAPLSATPLVLELLAKAADSGKWPKTRSETFELACRQLAEEWNQEHEQAAGDTWAVDDLLDAAGLLFAVALLTGHHAVRKAGRGVNEVSLGDIPNKSGSHGVLRAALRTGLFAYHKAMCATPIHRQVAEFLAARHIARRIDEGLPPGRVMALMKGPDGGVISSLSGLCAWLAAQNAKIRQDCIAVDPLGTILYGDVKEFTVAQKQELVAAIARLARHAPWILRNRFELDVRWGDLATRDTEPMFRDLLGVTEERLFNWLDVLMKQGDKDAWDSLSNWRRKNPDRWKDLHAKAHGQPRRTRILQAASDEKSWVPAPSDEDRRWREQWQAFLRTNRSQIQDSCPPDLLHELANMGWGSMPFVEGNLPIERLHSLLQDDSLVQLALGAIRDTPQRVDLPTFDEVATLRRSAPHPLSLPYRAAFDLLRASGVAKLGENELRLALAFQFEASIPGRDWYEATLKASPRMVASALVDYCRAAFRCGNIPHWPLAQLAQDAHAKVAEAATLDLLKMFPPRCRTEHLPTLRCLLFAALERCSRRKLSALIEHKLSLRGLTALQRVHWLCCGLTLDGARHLQPLLGLLAGRYQHQRIQCVVALMRERVLRVDGLDAPVVLPLIELLAEHCRPASLSDSRVRGPIPESVGEAADAADAVRRLLDHLASLAAAEATDALGQLAANVALSRWQPEVQHALTNQLATRREAEFRHASVAQVLATLDGAKPANAADLAALVADGLTTLAGRVAAGDTSDWRQYWNTEGKRVTEPKYEELCRDALLSDLRQDLPSGLAATSEAVHAGDRRADILVSFKDFAVPVEVKRSCHPHLWKAMHTQLIGSYANHPAAQGHGIYLVFWFGRDRCQLPPDGSQKPRTADELAARLRETLTPEQRRKITVIVMDVSGPAHIP